MTKRSRRTHSPAFKAKVALAAVKGDKTLAELAQQFAGVRPDCLHRKGGVSGNEVRTVLRNNDAKGAFRHARAPWERDIKAKTSTEAPVQFASIAAMFDNFSAGPHQPNRLFPNVLAPRYARRADASRS